MTDEARKSLCLILDNLVNLDNLCNNLYNLDNLYNLVNLDNLCNNMYNLDNLHNLNNLNNMCECFNHATVSYVVRQLLGVKDHGLGPGPVQHRGPQPGHHQDHPVLLAVPVHGEGLPDRHVRLQAPTPLPRPPAPGHGALLPQAVRQEPRQQRVRGLPQATDRDGLDEEISEAGQEPCPHFDQAWFYLLCELMMTPQAPFFKRSVSALILNKPSS